jgi:hypothetical protein
MPESVVTVTVTEQIAGSRGYEVFGTLAIAAGDYTNNGILLNFVQAKLKASRAPLFVEIYGIGGFIYSFVPGSTAANGLLRIFAQTNGAAEDAPLGQLAAAATPAAVVADTISFRAYFKGQL